MDGLLLSNRGVQIIRSIVTLLHILTGNLCAIVISSMLEDAQGSLAPEPLFVSRQKDKGTLVLSLELREPVSGDEEDLETLRSR